MNLTQAAAAGERAEFRTNSTALAAFIFAKSALPLLTTHCDESAPKTAVFVFDDPQGIGPQLETDYESGAVAPVRLVFNAYSTLKAMAINTVKQQRLKAVR